MDDDRKPDEKKKKPVAMVNFNIFNEVCVYELLVVLLLMVIIAIMNCNKKNGNRNVIFSWFERCYWSGLVIQQLIAKICKKSAKG